MTKPVKPFATLDEQIDVLASRGLALDQAVAEQWLRSVGYYRLSGYWYPYREIGDPQRANHLDRFVRDASFDDVVQLYEFDRKLRTPNDPGSNLRPLNQVRVRPVLRRVDAGRPTRRRL